MKRIILTAVLFVSTAVFAAEAVEFLVYRNPEAGFQMQYPNDWEKTKVQEAVVTFISPKENENDDFQENVNVSKEALPDNSTLENFSKTNIDQIKRLLPNAKILSSESAKLGGAQAHQLVYRGTQGDFDLQFTQIWTVRGKNAFIVSYAATDEGFKTYAPLIQRMIDSFEFIDL